MPLALIDHEQRENIEQTVERSERFPKSEKLSRSFQLFALTFVNLCKRTPLFSAFTVRRVSGFCTLHRPVRLFSFSMSMLKDKESRSCLSVVRCSGRHKAGPHCLTACQWLLLFRGFFGGRFVFSRFGNRRNMSLPVFSLCQQGR